jgi:3,4-dihydroxy 2-butanone 4-phosphate synthase
MKNTVEDAVKSLLAGNIVLLHDSEGRENETDMVAAAQHVTPSHIARMRVDAGGLICVAISKELSESIKLPFTSDIHASAKKDFPLLGYLTPDDIPYDEKSSFAVWVNHRKTFTGITDVDRALTVRKLAEILPKKPSMREFGRQFRSPGHVPLLRGSELENREGHTELSVALMKLARVTPAACICEMMDAVTHKALSGEKVWAYAKKNKLVYLEASQVKEAWRKRDG